MKAALLTESVEALKDCPVLQGPARSQFRDAAQAANRFSQSILTWLEGRPPKAKAAWLKTSVQLSRDVFQPWVMETIYLLAVLGPSRFTDLHEMLGVSTRTLSDKLKLLQEAGLVERTVYDEHPVRIEYALTKHGKRTAALASPLFAHLNLEALRAAGRT